MKLTFLGTGNAFAPQRNWATILVNDTILLDAGPCALAGMKRLQLSPGRIEHIFISHFHADHYFGLPFLLLDNYFFSRTDTPLAIIGPPGVEAQVTQLMTMGYPDVITRGWPRTVTFTEAQPGAPQTVAGLTFEAIPVMHASDRLQAFGYRIALSDGTLAYSGDTAMTNSLYALVDGARVAVLEAASQEESVVHLGMRALRQLVERAPQDCHIVLNHLDAPGSDPWQSLPVTVPEDLQTYEW